MNLLFRIDLGLVEVARRFLARQARRGRGPGDVQRSMVAAYAVFTFASAFSHGILVLALLQLAMAATTAGIALHPTLLDVPLRTRADFERLHALASRRVTDPMFRFVRISIVVFALHILVFLLVDWMANGWIDAHLAFVLLSMTVVAILQYVMAAPPSMPRSPGAVVESAPVAGVISRS